MVECLPFKKKVIGSIPCASLIKNTLNFYNKNKILKRAGDPIGNGGFL